MRLTPPTVTPAKVAQTIEAASTPEGPRNNACEVARSPMTIPPRTRDSDSGAPVESIRRVSGIIAAYAMLTIATNPRTTAENDAASSTPRPF